MKELKVSKGWFDILRTNKKPFDVRVGNRTFENNEIIKFVENETGKSFEAKIINILKSWMVPHEWGWLGLGNFEIITFEDLSETICGCTNGNIFGGSERPCQGCGHANGSHNFGKGCRVIHLTKNNLVKYKLGSKDVDYTKYKRLHN